MIDSQLFSNKKFKVPKGKSKFLLKDNFQKEVLKETLKIARKIKSKRDVEKVWIGGSILKKQLGKYIKKWNERIYSDIDLFVLTKNGAKLKEMGLVKKLHKTNSDKYYRISVADKNGQPLKILERFSVDVWLFTPPLYTKDLKKFPTLLDNTLVVY